MEAYPDVANNYVEVITQWPGISAEQMEQQVTIPLEIVMNGIPHVAHLRSFSLFGLSDLKLIFDDESDNAWNREQSAGAAFAGDPAAGRAPQMGTDWSPVGQIYFFTLHSTNPQYDVMELKSLEDWVLEKQFKSVPNVVDVASFGGPTREYQVRVDPEQADRLRPEHRRRWSSSSPTTTPTPAAASSRPACSRSTFAQWAWSTNVRDIGRHGDQDAERHADARQRHRRRGARARRSGWARSARAIRREDGKIVDNDDVV